MDIPDLYKISDRRRLGDLKKKTFSGYKKGDVFRVWTKSMTDGRLEETLHWGVELIVSGYIEELWEKLFLYLCSHINVVNISLVSHVIKRFKVYLNQEMDDLKRRNCQHFRNHMCEIMTMLALSEKRKLDVVYKVQNDDFTSEGIKSRLRAVTAPAFLTKINDPEELKMVSREICYSIQYGDMSNILYWVGWIMAWEKKMIRQHKQYICAYHSLSHVDVKYRTDMVWHLWEIVHHYSKQSCFQKEYQYLFEWYQHAYTRSKQIRRSPILVYAMKLLLIKNRKDSPHVDRYDRLIRAVMMINEMYREKKAYENDSGELKKYEKFRVICNKRDGAKSMSRSCHKLLKSKSTKKKRKNDMSEESRRKLDQVMRIGGMVSSFRDA